VTRVALALALLVICLFGHVREAMAKEPVAASLGALTVAEVLAALAATHPQLEAARQRQRAAEGEVMAARGGFDPVLRVRGQYVPAGAFPRGVVDVEVRQPTPLWGLVVHGGWRLGLGSFAVYDLRGKTADGGELRAGLSLPLWQGGRIDRRRADVRVAALAQDSAGAELEARWIELERAAGRAYWAWVGAGLRLAAQRDLLALAEDRDEWLGKQIAAGGVPAVEGLENRRAILERRARIVAAERALQQAAFDLARHLRDADGEVRPPAPARLPGAFPEPQRSLDALERTIQDAWDRRPDLRRLALQREAAAVELKLARNDRSPRVDLDAYASRDIGAVDPAYAYLRPAEFVVGVSVELPLALRGARGRLRRAEAELGRIDAELRMARDAVALEIRDAYSALDAAYARVGLAREQLAAAHELERAERSRFRLGDSTLLLVNLREQVATDAALQELDALGEYHRAHVDLRAAAGLPGPR